MKQLQAFAVIVLCLVMPALAFEPDEADWTVVTMAPDGAWGLATEPSAGVFALGFAFAGGRPAYTMDKERDSRIARVPRTARRN